MGHEVHAVVDQFTGRHGDASTFRQQGIAISTLRQCGGSEDRHDITARAFRRLLVRMDVAIVGGYTPRSARIVLATRRSRRPPTVLLAERPDHRTEGVRRSLRDVVIRLAIRRTDAVWAMSVNGRAAFEARGADVPILAPYPLPEATKRSNWFPSNSRDHVLKIVFVGSLDERKNPLMAAAALRILKRRGVSFQATFVGEGPLRDALLRALEGLPARLTGQIAATEVESELVESDVLLHPCHYDGWGMVVAEAIAAETSVVAGPMTDAASEFARLGPTVSIIQLDPESIADAIEAIAQHRGTHAHGRQLSLTRLAAEEHASAQTIAVRTLNALDRMTARFRG